MKNLSTYEKIQFRLIPFYNYIRAKKYLISLWISWFITVIEIIFGYVPHSDFHIIVLTIINIALAYFFLTILTRY